MKRFLLLAKSTEAGFLTKVTECDTLAEAAKIFEDWDANLPEEYDEMILVDKETKEEYGWQDVVNERL